MAITLEFLLFIFHSLLLSPAIAGGKICTDRHSYKELSILHVYSQCSPFSKPADPSPGLNSVLTLARRDPARLAYLSSLITAAPIASGQQVMQTANYIVRAKLGTPGQTMYMALDTSADTAWVPCSGCVGCPASTFFSPSSSTTFTSLNCTSSGCTQFKGQSCAADTGENSPCGFGQPYGGDSSITASVAQDSLTLGGDVVPNYLFGCVSSVTGGNSFPKQGLLGLGRGSTSLLSQAQSLYKGVFSYCLPSFKSYYFSGSLRLGPAGQSRTIRTTRLLMNPHRPSLYFVNLTGITVGRTRIAFPAGSFPFDPATGAGTIVDSGTVITRFVKPVYEALKAEFRRQVGAPEYTSLGAFDTCFDASEVTVPVVRLEMEGLDLPLPEENTLIHSSATPVACLAMAEAPDNVNAVVNVIASLQQQNHRVLVDVAGGRIGFAREVCN